MVGQETCIVVATHRMSGQEVIVASFLPEGNPLAYCADMYRRCRSHTDFRVYAGTWEEWRQRLAARQSQHA
jgi:hypothetical protein